MTEGSDIAPWVERLARVGYVAKAVLYGTIGVLAAAAPLGMGGGAGGGSATTNTRGAMAKMLDAPFGRMLLTVVALGLLGYAAWRMVQGVADPEHRGSDAKGLALRASSIGTAVIHLALAYSAIKLVTGRGSGSGGGNSSQRAAATAFKVPGGKWLLLAVAIGIAGYGAYQLYRAARAKLSKRLDTGEMTRETGRWVVGVSRFGIAARGIVFIAIGWLLSRAAIEHDPGRAGGIDAALDSLTHLGRWPFAAIAVGLIAYGVYELLNARYRRIRAE
jgi:uncharacterized protein DUF1206